MRTIKDILAENPDAKFSCNDVQDMVFDSDEILCQIRYCHENDEKPVVTYCEARPLKVRSDDVLDYISENWDDAYEGWELNVSTPLQYKLQQVLDEIIAENEMENIAYYAGEQLDITKVWNSLEELNNVS